MLFINLLSNSLGGMMPLLIIILLLGFVALALFLSSDKKWGANFAAAGVISLIGLLMWAIAVFDQLIPMGERTVWLITGLSIGTVGAIYMVRTVNVYRQQKGKRYVPATA